MMKNLDYGKAKDLGLTTSDRAVERLRHHPMSLRLVQFMATYDLKDMRDNFSIKMGGYGDNGENLMYLMDPFFEMLDLEDEVDESWMKEQY